MLKNILVLLSVLALAGTAYATTVEKTVENKNTIVKEDDHKNGHVHEKHEHTVQHEKKHEEK